VADTRGPAEGTCCVYPSVTLVRRGLLHTHDRYSQFFGPCSISHGAVIGF